MIRNFLFYILFNIGFFFGTLAFAQDFVCGEYVLNGVIGSRESQPVLVLYKGSMSEVVYKIPKELHPLALSLNEQPVALHGRILNPTRNRRGEVLVTKLIATPVAGITEGERFIANYFREDLYDRVPDPLYPDKDSKIELIKKLPCLKR